MMDSQFQSVRSCKMHFLKVPSGASLSALSRTIAQKEYPAILGANESVRGCSIFCAEPVERFAFYVNETDPFEKLRTVLNRYQIKGSDPFIFGEEENKKVPDTFHCGWIGYFAYELGRFIEKLPEQAVMDLPLPLIYLAFYDKAIVYDHDDQHFTFLAVEIEGENQTVRDKFDTLAQWIGQADKQTVQELPAGDLQKLDFLLPDCNMTEQEYYESLKKIRKHIYDGDVYQINFSQRFSVPFDGSPIDLFCWQNQHNPNPYAAYLQADEGTIVSASPELFLQVQQDQICTRPIKGTRRRVHGPNCASVNLVNRNDLVESEKDQAELAMIVDLERNDLARICIPGSRHVTCMRQIETFPTVYHAVSTIKGVLPDRNSSELFEKILRSTFPGGSITGAPKIRAMEIIDDLEPTARSVYTGSIGWVGLNFDVQLNIAIRTIMLCDKKAYIQVGGGIVADSDARSEWDETLMKARALLAGLEAVQQRTIR